MTEETKRPLSEKPLGYILAAAGGLLGGPIGVLLSLIVLFTLSAALKPKDGRVPNRFKYWMLSGIVGVPLSLMPFMGGGGSNPGTPQVAGVSSDQKTGVASGQIIPRGSASSVRGDRSLAVSNSNTLSSISVSNPYMEPIQPKGGELVAVYLTISNTGNTSGNMFWTTFQLVDSQGRRYDNIQDLNELVTLGAWAKEQGLAESGDQLFPGASAQTVAVFRVAPGAQGLYLLVNQDKKFAIY
jgi:hypothetical protein